MKKIIIIIIMSSLLCGIDINSSNSFQKFYETSFDNSLSQFEKNNSSFENLDILYNLGQIDKLKQNITNSNLSKKEKKLYIMQLSIRNLNFKKIERNLLSFTENKKSDKYFEIFYNWLKLTENYSKWQSTFEQYLKITPRNTIHNLAKADFLLSQFQFEKSITIINNILNTEKKNSKYFNTAKFLKAKYFMKQYNFVDAENLLIELLENNYINENVLTNLGWCFIRNSKVSDAIFCLKKTLEINPLNENAHYQLGNGYTDKTYSELFEIYTNNFITNSENQATLNAITNLLNDRNITKAKKLLQKLIKKYPQYVEPYIYLGSINWEENKYSTALKYFQIAVNIVPEYGRANNGIAKSIEGLKRQNAVYYKNDNNKFIKTSIPKIEQIEKYILNWNSLSPRIQKRVAISVKPWKNFIPVLVASESYHYIKPLYSRLSECPGLESMKDARISYDSRLWDDVRGCGGFTTVTGIEDVERMIFHKYNTILHEMTHQVHYVLTQPEKDKIEKVYNTTKQKEENGIKTFISRYQSASVWEYFAEGANSYYSPKRNKYDTREIVKERLFAMDTPLIELVEYFSNISKIDKYYPVAFSNTIYNKLEKADTIQTYKIIKKANKLKYSSASLLDAKCYAEMVFGNYEKALEYANLLIKKYPKTINGYNKKIEILFHQGKSIIPELQNLENILPHFPKEQAYLGYLTIGEKYYFLGQYNNAISALQKVTNYEPEHDRGNWLLALCYGETGKFQKSENHFKKVLKRRNGLLNLRADYVKILLKNDKKQEAELQYNEMLALDKNHYLTYQTGGIINEYDKNLQDAEKKYLEATKIYKWDLYSNISLTKLNSQKYKKMIAQLKIDITKPPHFYYNEKYYRYESVNEWNSTLINLFNKTTNN